MTELDETVGALPGLTVPLSALPSVDGVVSAAEVARTAASIAALQHPCGAVPWAWGKETDVWNHVEAAMGLLVGGEVEAAERAYAWAAGVQRADGSWPLRFAADLTGDADQLDVDDERSEVNNSAYLAVGVWHHWLVRRDPAFVRRLWPAVRAGLDWVVAQQLPFGGLRWTPEEPDALLSGSASVYQSLRAGVALAALADEPQPEWELAGGRLGHALREHRDRFADKSTFAMDWYYPVLGGAVRGDAGRDLLGSRWDDFVVAGLGSRCVDTNPWVTAAETCELVMALDAVGEHGLARQLLLDVQHFRDLDGGYVTGWVCGDDVFWPREPTTYSGAAMILAADALGEVMGHGTAGSGIMRGTSLATPFPELALECGCD